MFTPVKIFKHPSIPINSNIYDTSIKKYDSTQKGKKKLVAATSSKKSNLSQKMPSPVFITTSEAKIFKQKHILKENMHMRTMNKGKDITSPYEKNPSEKRNSEIRMEN